MVRALDGDSTMTSLVPRPPPVAGALAAAGAPPAALALAVRPVPVFGLAVPVLAGTLFLSSPSRQPSSVSAGDAAFGCNRRPGSVGSLGPPGLGRRFCHHRLNLR